MQTMLVQNEKIDRGESVDNDEPGYDPEDCQECGCLAGDFDDEDWDCGAWTCPKCGAAQ